MQSVVEVVAVVAVLRDVRVAVAQEARRNNALFFVLGQWRGEKCTTSMECKLISMLTCEACGDSEGPLHAR